MIDTSALIAALVAVTCVDRGFDLVTLDRRQHAVALSFGARSTLLLPSE